MSRLFQFFRIMKVGMRPGNKQVDESGQTVYKKRGAPETLKEADRAMGSAPHVAKPLKPILVSGVRPLELLTWLKQMVSKARDKRGRALHPDTNIMISGLISYPVSSAEIQQNADQRETHARWEEYALRFLRKWWGARLACVVRHIDETYFHLHFFIVPDFANGESNLLSIDPSTAAAARAAPTDAPSGLAFKMRKSAMATAMRQLQDDFYREVSVFFGHERIGPARRRQSPKEKQEERQRMQAAALADTEAKKIRAAARADADRIRAKAREDREAVQDLLRAMIPVSKRLIAQGEKLPPSVSLIIADAKKFLGWDPDPTKK